MGKVTVDVTMPLDRFIAGPSDSLEHPLGLRSAERLHDWLFTGDTPSPHHAMFKRAGANVAGAHCGTFPSSFPCRSSCSPIGLRPSRSVGATSFTFVRDGIEEAVERARAVAGGNDVSVGGGAKTIQQAMRAHLVDEMQGPRGADPARGRRATL